MFEAKLLSFEDGNERSATTAPRTAALRAELARRALTGIIVPRAERQLARIRWLDDYHARVAGIVAPQVDAETRAWLGATTRPIRSASRRRSSR